MAEDQTEKPQNTTPDTRKKTSRREFIEQVGGAAIAGATFLGVKKFAPGILSQNTSTTSENSTPEATPQSPTDQQPEQDKINTIEFPYENKDTLTQDEFNTQFDRIYKEAIKATPNERFGDSATFFTSREEMVQLGTYAPRDIAPLSEELYQNNDNIQSRVLHIISKESWTHTNKPRYPRHFDAISSTYIFPEGRKPRGRYTYTGWTGNLENEERTTQGKEMSSKDLFDLAKSVTEEFNWAVTNNAFYKEPTPPPPPRFTFPQETTV